MGIFTGPREQHIVGTGAQTVAAAGTAIALSATKLNVYSASIVANSGNTNNIYIGDSTVDKATNKSIPLGPGGVLPITAQAGYNINLAKIFIDADTNGNGVTFMYLQ